MRARLATLILAAGVSLGGCAYGGGYGGLSVGSGYGSPYGYGYGSPYAQAGYGGYGGYGYSPYGRYNPYYRSPYFGSPYYGSPYMGWYDNYYYPGHGYYVYDRDRNPRRISDADRNRWVRGIRELAAHNAAQRENGTSTTATTNQAGARNAPVRQRVTRDRSSLSGQLGDRARSDTRRETRATTRTERSSTRSSSDSLGSTLRRRTQSSDD